MPASAQDALRFFLGDARRLRLGNDDALLTRQLLGAAAPHLQPADLSAVERLTLAVTGKVRPFHEGIAAVRWRGIDQLHLLRTLTRVRLTHEGRDRLDELERKFPEIQTRGYANDVHGGFVGSPIPTESVKRMSDGAWLRAMAKYAHGVEHREFLRGGAMQLGRELQALVKANPLRFADLAARTPPDLDDHYADAFISGLAESQCSPDVAFSVVRRFTAPERPGVRRSVAWALQQLLARVDRLPTDLITLLEAWVWGVPGDDEAWYEAQQQDLSHAALNTDRGAALRTLLAALSKEEGDHAVQRRWDLLERTARDPSSILRAAGLEALMYMVRVDHDRAITVFEAIVRNQPRLQSVPAFRLFLYYASFGRFSRTGPYIREMVHAELPETRQRGAELAVLGYLSPRGLENTEAVALATDLAQEIMGGPADLRRGAARIFAHNLADHPADECEAGLRRLLDDPDLDVRREVAWMTHRLRPEHMITRQSFLSAFAGSWAVRSGLQEFTEFVWEHCGVDPAWALTAVETLLDSTHPNEHQGWFGSEEHLVRLTLRVYTDPLADAELRERAMRGFDRLMERFSSRALNALSEWDRA
jgi:hypothetical protein